jgi:transcription initiation factor TFIIE subunit alpha
MNIPQKKVEQVIGEIVGLDVLPLVRYLKTKKNISEFTISEGTGMEVNTIRNMLYRLYDTSLVTFIRKKDKIKGWYIYYWTFDPKHITHLEQTMKERKLSKLNDRLKRENATDFYICNNKCIRLSFEQSMEFEYKCPECGELLHPEDNAQTIKDIEKEIKKLEKDLKNKK